MTDEESQQLHSFGLRSAHDCHIMRLHPEGMLWSCRLRGALCGVRNNMVLVIEPYTSSNTRVRELEKHMEETCAALEIICHAETTTELTT